MWRTSGRWASRTFARSNQTVDATDGYRSTSTLPTARLHCILFAEVFIVFKKTAIALGLVSSGALLWRVGGAPRVATERPGAPGTSGFYDFFTLGADAGPGVGTYGAFNCQVSGPLQLFFLPNSLVDCDGEVPHNETSIAVNPVNPLHAVGGYHSYQLNFMGATVNSRVISTVSLTTDGGASWREVLPPITPYQFTGDPALAFNASGRVYLASIADHEGPGQGNFTAPSVVVQISDDGGNTWTNPITVATGKGAVDKKSGGRLVFQDKEWIAADTYSASPYRNRAYITWTSFQEFFNGAKQYAISPIQLARSDDGVNWSAAQDISGAHPACSHFNASPNACDSNQFSVPAVASSGRVYVGFENFNTQGENQYMVVRSDDGGSTFSNPVRIDAVHDINLPSNISGRDTLTGCAMRMASPGNIAVDPGNPNALYAVWADNRNGTAGATNMDIVLARSADGGLSWARHAVGNTANDQFYPWVAVAPNGRVDIGYMDRSYSAGQNVCQYGFSLTHVSFLANGSIGGQVTTRVDSALSDAGRSRWFSGATGGPTLFIGDYNGIAVARDGRTYSLWTDMRNVVDNPPASARNHGQHAVAGSTGP